MSIADKYTPQTANQINLLNKDILQEAHDIINGPRKEAYGPVEESFQRIADVATMLIRKNLSAIDIAYIMIAVKLIRETTVHGRDNLVDLAGYTALLGKLHGE